MKNAKLVFVSLFLAALSGPIIAAELDTAHPAESVVNINQASAVELAERLTGIGEEKAAAIIEYRETHGPFQSAQELVDVKGVGEAILSANESRIEL